MKKLILTILTILITTLVGCSGFISVSNLPETEYTYDMGAASTYYTVRPTKMVLLDMDGPYMYFDLVSYVEIINNSNEDYIVDVKCVYGKNGKRLKGLSKKNIRLRARSGKLVKISAYFKDTSVYGYGGNCRAEFYKDNQ